MSLSRYLAGRACAGPCLAPRPICRFRCPPIPRQSAGAAPLMSLKFRDPHHREFGCGSAQAPRHRGGAWQHYLVAEVLPDVPSVADLHRVGHCRADGLGIGGGAVPAHDLDSGVRAQPGRQRGTRPVGHINAFAGLGVDDDRGIAVAPFEREVVHADDPGHMQRGQRQSHQHPQCGRTRHRGSQYTAEAGARPTR